MSLDGEDIPAFSNIRNRFEELARAGPSRPSSLANRNVALRTSSDRLHDRSIPGGLPPRPSQLSVASQPSARHRVISNPDRSEYGALNAPSPSSPLSSPSSPIPSPTSATTPVVPPSIPPRPYDVRGPTSSSSPTTHASRLGRKPPPLPRRRSAENLMDDDSASVSVASLRSKYATIPFSSPPAPHTSSKSLSVPDLNRATDASASHQESFLPSPSQKSVIPIVLIREPGNSGALEPSVTPDLPPRPGLFSTPPTPSRSFTPILRTSPKIPPRPTSRQDRTLLIQTSDPTQTELSSLHPDSTIIDSNGSDSRSSYDSSHSDVLSSGSSKVSTAPSSFSIRPPFDRPLHSGAGGPPPIPPRPASQAVVTGPARPTPPNLPLITIPPPLPMRKNYSLPLTTESQSPLLPPRTTSVLLDPFALPLPPPLPPPRQSVLPALSNSGVLPPPIRTIRLNSVLPPARRLNTHESDESSDSGDEDDFDAEQSLPGYNGSGVPRKRLDDLPTTSHASRRPPVFRPGFNVHAAAHVSVVAVAGNCVCVGSHSIKVYDLDSLDSPVFVFDVKDVGLEFRHKEHSRITTMEFRPSMTKADEGRFLWCGMRDGHVFEFDAWTGNVCDIRPNCHTATITHILRHGPSMVVLCENGKGLIFSPSEGGKDLSLAHPPPSSLRQFRVPDKQGFVRIFGDHLWTANGPGNHSAGAATALRGPAIRVYDLQPGTTASRTLIPSEAVGQVASGTALPSKPENVYIGHEGGTVSIWSRDDGTGTPIHVGTIKVGTSAVLALEGVHARLWAGFRNGIIMAYDVESTPWNVTNMWRAHDDCPISKIEVDPHSIEKCARLTVYTIGRDERVRFWDGLLSLDYIESELLKREAKYSTLRSIKVLICSWNIDASKPDMLSSNGNSVSFLPDCLKSLDTGENGPDIIVFGFQEVIDLEDRKLTAKTMLLGGGKKKKEGILSDGVSSRYRLWLDYMILSIRTANPSDCPYSVIHTENLVGLLSCVFVKNSERHRIKDSAITTIKRGLHGHYGNKGAIAARFTIDDSSLCFINCHLAAGQNHTRERNADLAAILEDKPVFLPVSSEDSPVAYVRGGDGSMILDHEICFLSGDLNYRIDQRRDNVVSSIKTGELDYLLQHDQLLKEMKNNPSFHLRPFREAPLAFTPTYKYDRFSHEFDTSEKRRIPAWCDRILFRSRRSELVECLHYQRYEANTSDHRPISGGFRVTTKTVRQDERLVEKEKVQGEWFAHEQELLREAHRFYLREMRL